MRITIFGATGLLGKDLAGQWSQDRHADDQVVGLGTRDADIRDEQQVLSAVRHSRPDWVVLAAAYTDVDGCESNQDLAFAVNRDGALNVASAAKTLGARLLFISTDYVFDGKSSVPYETDHRRAPQSVYGRTKAEAEERILDFLPGCCIVRTSWLFGVSGRCFPETILKLATSRPEIDVVTDQRGSPTYSVDLARAVIQLCRLNAEGTVHATNRGDCSWFEFAQGIVRRSGLTTVVRPTTSDKFVRPAPRPAYSVLSPKTLQRYGIVMPEWQDALGRYLTARVGA